MLLFATGLLTGIALTALFVGLSLWVISRNEPKIRQFFDSQSAPAVIVGDDDDTAEVRKIYAEADRLNQDIQIL